MDSGEIIERGTHEELLQIPEGDMSPCGRNNTIVSMLTQSVHRLHCLTSTCHNRLKVTVEDPRRLHQSYTSIQVCSQTVARRKFGNTPEEMCTTESDG